jgi:nicotinate-nucleotide adenylyltransferase
MMTAKNKNIGLFFGSFNPIHVGHVIIANYMVEFEGMDEVWFVVSPQNPFKQKSELISEEIRLEMVNIAVAKLKRVKASNTEFGLPQPSYTINTLNFLTEKYPGNQFHLLMGSDNIINIHRWREADTIINGFPKLVYPRNGYAIISDKLPAKTKVTNAPIVDISSTMIREWIAAGHDVRTFVPEGIFEYVEEKRLYRDKV